MIFALPKKFRDYVAGRYVDPNIPDDLLKELKKFNDKLKERSGIDYFDFPDKKKN